MVDADRVGRGVNVMLPMRLMSHAGALRQAFEAMVITRPEIIECYWMSGELDYLMRIVAADVADYERFLMREL